MTDTTMKKYRNAGKLDRSLRVVMGAVLIYFGFIDASFISQSLLATLIGIFGVINILVAATGVCPVYTLAGISTCDSHGVKNSAA